MKRLLYILALVLAQGVAFGAGAPIRTPTDKVNVRLRQMHIQISRDEKAGKLTKAQAKTLRGQIEVIRKAEIADLKQNGTKTLTDDQVNQLNQQLNTLSKSIPIR